MSNYISKSLFLAFSPLLFFPPQWGMPRLVLCHLHLTINASTCFSFVSQFLTVYTDAWIGSSRRTMLNSYFLRHGSFVLYRETNFVWQPNLSRDWPEWHPRSYSFRRIYCEWNKQGRFLFSCMSTLNICTIICMSVLSPFHLYNNQSFYCLCMSKVLFFFCSYL